MAKEHRIKAKRDKKLGRILNQIMRGRDKLLEGEYIRTRRINSELGEWFVRKNFGMEYANKNQKGYDLIDKNGKRVEVKTRVRKEGSLVIRGLHKKEFDYLMEVILNHDLRIGEVWEIPYKVVMKKIKSRNTKSFSLTKDIKDRNDVTCHIFY